MNVQFLDSMRDQALAAHAAETASVLDSVDGIAGMQSILDGIDVSTVDLDSLSVAVRAVVVGIRTYFVSTCPQGFMGFNGPMPERGPDYEFGHSRWKRLGLDAPAEQAKRATRPAGTICCCGNGTCRVGPFVTFTGR